MKVVAVLAEYVMISPPIFMEAGAGGKLAVEVTVTVLAPPAVRATDKVVEPLTVSVPPSPRSYTFALFA